MKKLTVAILCSAMLAFAGPTQAQEQPDFSQLQQLQLSETQVQSLFSIFMSRAPEFLSEEVDTQRILNEVAPRALEVLTPEQRSFLVQLAPEEQLTRFGEMTRSERTDFVLQNAKQLVHPSKQEWIDRVGEMATPPSRLDD